MIMNKVLDLINLLIRIHFELSKLLKLHVLVKSLKPNKGTI